MVVLQHGVGSDGIVIPGRQNHIAKSDDFAKAPHKALDQARPNMPKRMPPPGYAGHLHATIDSTETYGTSRWVPPTPPDHKPRTLPADHQPISSGWPLSSGQPNHQPAGYNAAAVSQLYEKTISTLGNF